MDGRSDESAIVDAVQTRWTELAPACIRNSAAISAWSRESDALVSSRVDPGTTRTILDLACGCGDPSLSLAAAYRSARVIAVDFVEAMTTEVTRRARDAKLDNLETRTANMLTLPFSHSQFDVVTCRFGLQRYSAQLKRRVLEEAFRVLTPGGRLIVVDWGVEGHGAIHGFYQDVLAPYDPTGVLNPDANLIDHFDDVRYAQLFRQAGFENISHSYPEVHWSWRGTPGGLWTFVRDVVPPVRTILSTLSARAHGAVEQRIAYVLERYASNGWIVLPARNVLVTGVK